MAAAVQIANRWVGDGHACFIIAEAGSNHGGRLDQAKRLIDVAADAGADAVKFQLFRADRLYPKTAGQSDYLKLDRPIFDIIAEMEMPYEWLPELASYGSQRGIIFLCSVFDEESADRLDPYLPAYKIASYEMTHLPLVRHVAKKGKPMIVSTGTADLGEVAETMEALLGAGNERAILMQCTASYPAPLGSLNVRAVATLKERFGVPAGLSDHSRDPLIGPLAAVAVGANVVEKHFTLSNLLSGPDHAFSLEPEELRLMVRKIRETEQALGTGLKVVDPVEEELRQFARRAVFAVRDIRTGQRFSEENIAVLRCGKLAAGLPPRYYDEVRGRTARRDLPAWSPVRREDYA